MHCSEPDPRTAAGALRLRHRGPPCRARGESGLALLNRSRQGFPRLRRRRIRDEAGAMTVVNAYPKRRGMSILSLNDEPTSHGDFAAGRALMPDVLWTPSRAAIQQTRMTAFTDWLSQRTGLTFPDYDALHRWSIEHLEDFWGAYLEFTGLITSAQPANVLSAHVMPGAHWFAGMQLNFAENILGRDFAGPAIVACVEPPAGGSEGDGLFGSAYSFRQLRG